MELPVIEVYSSIECPFAYLATYRLRQVFPEYRERVQLAWRALSLEYINQKSYARPLFEAEHELFRQIEPNLPWQSWNQPEWVFPSTHWPAFEALACAQAQGVENALEMSWALRRAYFEESRNISLRSELFEIARSLAGSLSGSTSLDLDRFQQDWDQGSYKRTVQAESQTGWKQLKVEGSPTLVLPDGSQVNNPGVGEADVDEEAYVVRSYTPYQGDPLEAYRDLFERAARSG